MRISFPFILTVTLLLSLMPVRAFSSSRVQDIVAVDVTERLETIDTLKKSLRELKVQLSVYSTALDEEKSKKSHKKIFVNSKKVADAVTAFTILGGTIASHYFKDDVKVIKIASLIGGLSASTSVLTNLMADLSNDQVQEIQDKIDDLNIIIKASIANLNNEIQLLCQSEPSNQMCR